MPYALSGVCYSAPATALNAFQASYPFIDANGFVAHVSSSITAGGVISYSVAHRLWTSNILNSRTGTFQLPSCTEVTAESFDPVQAAGVFAVFFAGVVTVYLVSQSIGSIVEAIKRW